MNEATECGRSVEYKVNKMRVRRPGFDVGSDSFAVVEEKIDPDERCRVWGCFETNFAQAWEKCWRI